MNTYEELVMVFKNQFDNSGYAVESGKILEKIITTKKYKFLKKRMISQKIDIGILDSIVNWFLHIEINEASDEEWNMFLFIYIQILRYEYYISSQIAPALFTYKNIERCKQVILIHSKYNYPVKLDITQFQEIIDIYPNLKLFMSWYNSLYNIFITSDHFKIACITHDSYELKKLLKSDLYSRIPCTRACETQCVTYKSVNPDKFPLLYSPEQVAIYKNDETTKILNLVKKPWNPSVNKYWPCSYREFVKTMLLISNRSNTLSILSKDSLFCVIKMLGRNAFSNNIINKLNTDENRVDSELKGTSNKIYDFCCVCGVLTKNRCMTCRKQGIETRYCGMKCIEYDWENHRKFHM